jgi:hypothetical protein
MLGQEGEKFGGWTIIGHACRLLLLCQKDLLSKRTDEIEGFSEHCKNEIQDG